MVTFLYELRFRMYYLRGGRTSQLLGRYLGSHKTD